MSRREAIKAGIAAVAGAAVGEQIPAENAAVLRGPSSGSWNLFDESEFDISTIEGRILAEYWRRYFEVLDAAMMNGT